MKNILAFTIRNTKLFFRDKAVFFFSVMSSLIMILLYFLFIANIYIDAMNTSAGSVLSGNAAGFVVYSQMMAGILVLNSMSLSLGMFTSAARDLETQKINSFLVTPAKKWEFVISYFIGGVIISFILNLFAWVVSVLLIGIITGYWIFAATFFLGIVVLIVASLISASIMMLITVAVKSSIALGVINGVAGTFLGFLCGIYMPYSNLGKGVEAVGSFFPFTHLTVWFKNIVLNDAFSQIGITGTVKDTIMKEQFSANSVGFCGLNVPLWLMLLFSGVIAGLCLLVAGLIFKKRIRIK